MAKQRIAVVTGGMGGLGETISTKMADAGYSVAVTYSPANKASAKWLTAMKDKGYDFKAYGCDVTDFESSKACVRQVACEVGPVDILVNNAGITRDMTFRKMGKSDWDAVLKTNLDSVFNMTKQVIRPMMKAKKGSIINMSSIIGMRGNAGQTSYAASKAGIIGFTKSVALELGSRNIRCNAIAPGFIETDMTHYLKEGEAAKAFLEKIPLGRFGTAEEIANTTLFLASDLSSYITGQVISACGGLNT